MSELPNGFEIVQEDNTVNPLEGIASRNPASNLYSNSMEKIKSLMEALGKDEPEVPEEELTEHRAVENFDMDQYDSMPEAYQDMVRFHNYTTQEAWDIYQVEQNR